MLLQSEWMKGEISTAIEQGEHSSDMKGGDVNFHAGSSIHAFCKVLNGKQG